MKILHVPYCYYPDAVGGTEVYVAALAERQRAMGLEPMVAAPGARQQQYANGGLQVYRFATGDVDLRGLYGVGDETAARNFGEVLRAADPDVVHLHAFTSGVSVLAARQAKQAGRTLISTYHTPTVSCLRGTLLEMGARVCDGVLDVERCAACSLEANGAGKGAAAMLSQIPLWMSKGIGDVGLQGGPWTALRMKELASLRIAAFRELMETADHVVAVCEWVRDLLVANGVPDDKVTVSRQGVSSEVFFGDAAMARDITGPLRIAFLGRIDPVKGLNVLLEAIAAIPEAKLEFDVFGVSQDERGRALWEATRSRYEQDKRIRFNPSLPAAEVVGKLREYDLLAVPSQWMETGPLVVYEAFQAGIPVIGTDLGGIRELVRDGVNGRLVRMGAVSEWSRELARLAGDRSEVARLRAGVEKPRTMSDAAREMAALYEQCLASKGQGSRVS